MIDGATSLARRFHVSDLFIGLTIIAFGTSTPELVINIIASFNGATDIAVGNILGSNIANVLLVLGVAALVYPLTIKHNLFAKEIPLSLGAIVLLGIMVNDRWFEPAGFSGLSRVDGLILVLGFLGYIYYVYRVAKTSRAEIKKPKQVYKTWLAVGMFLIGIIGLVIGGQLVIVAAQSFSKLFGLSQTFVGLTIVALGTSLPELVTSAVAAYKRKADIAIGNVIGSNILNICWALGLSAIIRPMSFGAAYNMDIFILMLATFILFLWLTLNKNNRLTRWQGLILVLLYVAYIATVVFRE